MPGYRPASLRDWNSGTWTGNTYKRIFYPPCAPIWDLHGRSSFSVFSRSLTCFPDHVVAGNASRREATLHDEGTSCDWKERFIYPCPFGTEVIFEYTLFDTNVYQWTIFHISLESNICHRRFHLSKSRRNILSLNFLMSLLHLARKRPFSSFSWKII